jgi:membrane protein DedA with SNARE-associated domain
LRRHPAPDTIGAVFNLTGIAWLDAVLAFFSAHGYLATFMGGLLENVFIVGGFMPGETVVMAVAFLASDPTTGLSPIVIWLVSVLGTMAGSNISYAIGHRGGRPMLLRIGRRFPKLQDGLFKAEEYFEAHGSKTVFISRFTAGFKNWMPTLAGATHMRLPIFELYTLLSAMVYSTGLVIIGYFFGDNMDVIVAWFKEAGVWATVALVAAIAAYVGYRVWRSRSIDQQVEERLEHEAEQDAAELGLEPHHPEADADAE